MLTLSYICVGLSVALLLIVGCVIRAKEKKRRLRYYGIIKERNKTVYKL